MPQIIAPTTAERNRETAAVNLVARHLSERNARHIRRTQAGTLWVWKVESQTDAAEVYSVTLEADGWPATTCSCPDHTYRHMRCKHITAVELLAQPAQPAAVAPRKVRREPNNQEDI